MVHVNTQCEKLTECEKFSVAGGRFGTAPGDKLTEEPVPDKEGPEWQAEVMAVYSRRQPSLKNSHDQTCGNILDAFGRPFDTEGSKTRF